MVNVCSFFLLLFKENHVINDYYFTFIPLLANAGETTINERGDNTIV